MSVVLIWAIVNPIGLLLLFFSLPFKKEKNEINSTTSSRSNNILLGKDSQKRELYRSHAVSSLKAKDVMRETMEWKTNSTINTSSMTIEKKRKKVHISNIKNNNKVNIH